MSTIKMGGGPGGTVQGNYGTYPPSATDGFYTVDVRDVPQLLAAGLVLLRNGTEAYTTPISPRNASAGRIAASAALSNGAVTIANQPDVARQLNVILGNQGSPSLSGGSLSLTYTGSDAVQHTDVFSYAIVPQSGSITLNTSRPVAHIVTGTISGVTGGTTPFFRIDDANVFGLPADPGAQDFSVSVEYDGGTLMTSVGTPSVSCIGATTVQNAPTGTSAYSWIYGFVAPLRSN